MKWSWHKISPPVFILLFLFSLLFSQAIDSQTAWVKTVVANDTFTGKIVGFSDSDTISVMREGRAEKRRLWAGKNPIPPWEWPRGERGYTKKEQISGLYRSNVESHVFHRPGCRYYDCTDCTATFKSREEAIKAGYKPCKVCKP